MSWRNLWRPSAASALVLLLWPLSALGSELNPSPSRPWALTLFSGIGTDGGIEDFPGLQADFNDAYMVGLGVSRTLGQWQNRMAFEVEGQLAKHFVKQDHAEANLLAVARWIDFPWNDRVATTMAIGEGVSLASSVPEIERERSPGKTSRLLNYLMIEVELAPPAQTEWSFVARIHHRSGIFGTFDGVSKGSNLVVFGIRHRF